MNDEFLWVEAFRPKKIEDCILPPRLKTIFLQYVKTKQVPNLLLTGGPGSGKTTVAKALCNEIGLNYLFINSSEERGIDTLRVKIKNYASTVSLVGGQKVIILDEADYITPDAQAALRGAIEQFSNNCTFILTCNYKSKLIDAIHSRCTVIDFKLSGKETELMAKEFFKRLETILDIEKVEYEKPVLAEIVKKYFPDYRRTINELQRLSTFGKLDSSTLTHLSDIRNIKELYEFLKNKKFTQMRKWVVENGDIDPSRIFRKIYDSLSEYMEPSSIPQAVLIIARYQYQAAFVADAEINLVAFLTEIMVDAQFKS